MANLVGYTTPGGNHCEPCAISDVGEHLESNGYYTLTVESLDDVESIEDSNGWALASPIYSHRIFRHAGFSLTCDNCDTVLFTRKTDNYDHRNPVNEEGQTMESILDTTKRLADAGERLAALIEERNRRDAEFETAREAWLSGKID